MNKMNKINKWILAGLIVIVLLGASAFAFTTRETTATVAEAAAATQIASARASVVAEGAILPVRRADLSFSVAGVVAEILVQEGQPVEAGQVILRLANSSQQATVAGAQAALGGAQARLSDLQAGASPADLAAAQAALDAAQGQLDRLTEAPRSADLDAARAELNAANAALATVLRGTGADRLIAAQADLANAEAAVRQAQAAYDRVKGDANIGALPQSLQLQQATNAYDAARARLSELEKAPDAADIAIAQARVEQAKAVLAALEGPAPDSEMAIAEAQVRQAQAQLESLRAGSRSDVIACAAADVAAAQAALDQARVALSETELRAPFGGTLALLDVGVGERVSPGAVVARVADLASWEVVTTDLTELDVAAIAPGDPVTVTVDALPGVEMAGEVVRTADVGETERGEINYAVTIALSETDPRVRWNMTAAAEFPPK